MNQNYFSNPSVFYDNDQVFIAHPAGGFVCLDADLVEIEENSCAPMQFSELKEGESS